MSDSDQQPQPGHASAIAAGLIMLVIFLLPAAGFVWLRMASQTTAGSHMLWHTHSMLLRHFARTGGQWPQSWDDLAEDFEPTGRNFGTPHLEAMKQKVGIDFSLDVATLGDPELAEEKFHVLWRKDGTNDEQVDAINARLLDALRERIASS